MTGAALAMMAACDRPIAPDGSAASSPRRPTRSIGTAPSTTTLFTAGDGISAITSLGRAQLVPWNGATYFFSTALSPDGRVLYTTGLPRSVHAYDTQSGALLAQINLPAGTGYAFEPLYALAVTPDGSKILVGTPDAPSRGKLYILNAVTLAQEQIVSDVVYYPHAVLVSRDGRYAYVAERADGEALARVDLTAGAVTARVSNTGASEAGSLALSPGDTLLYVSRGNFVTVSVIDTRSMAKVADFLTSRSPGPIALTPDGAYLYIGLDGASFGSAWVEKRRTSDGSLLTTHYVPSDVGGVRALALSRDGERLHVATTQGPTGWVLVFNKAGAFLSYVNGGFVPLASALFEPPPGVTGVGANVPVTPIDPATGSTPVTLTFATVTASGTTTVTSSGAGAPPPLGFKLGNPPVYYDLQTTATFVGSVTVCFGYTPAAFQNASNLRLFHGGTDGAWTDVTTSNDPAAGRICGSVTSFSPFVFAELAYDFVGFAAPVDNPGSGAIPVVNTVKAGSAVPVKFSLGGNLGLNVLAPQSPASAAYACAASSDTPIEETVSALANAFSYDASTSQYVYVWKTDKAWAGTCRKFTLTLADGTAHEALFRFQR